MDAASIILPVYNSEKTINRAIRSCLQSMSYFDELVVVDDASNDGTTEKLELIQDPRVRVLRNPVNRGISYSLNRALAESSYDLIGRMDADDVTLPWRFDLQKRQIKHLEADLLFSAAILRYKVGGLRIFIPQIVQSLNSNSSPKIDEALLLNCFVVHPTMLARRKILEELGGWPNVYPEDWTLWLDALKSKAKIHRSAFPVLIYSISTESKSRREPVDFSSNETLRSLILQLSEIGSANSELIDFANRVLKQYKNPIRRFFDHGLDPKMRIRSLLNQAD